jgi:hypothetical protein
MTIAGSGQLLAPSLACDCCAGRTSPDTTEEIASSSRNVKSSGVVSAHAVWPRHRSGLIETFIDGPFHIPDGSPAQRQVVGAHDPGTVEADVDAGLQLVIRHPPVNPFERCLQFETRQMRTGAAVHASSKGHVPLDRPSK